MRWEQNVKTFGGKSHYIYRGQECDDASGILVTKIEKSYKMYVGTLLQQLYYNITITLHELHE